MSSIGDELRKQPDPGRRRSRPVWIAMGALGVALGLGSRRYAEHLPGFLAAYAGDTLWAFVAFLGIGLLLPRDPTWVVAVVTMLFSAAIELSQLYHAPWIDSIRRTTLGGLVLGYGFLWGDLACYALGVGLGSFFELIPTSPPRPAGTPAGWTSGGSGSPRTRGVSPPRRPGGPR